MPYSSVMNNHIIYYNEYKRTIKSIILSYGKNIVGLQHITHSSLSQTFSAFAIIRRGLPIAFGPVLHMISPYTLLKHPISYQVQITLIVNAVWFLCLSSFSHTSRYKEKKDNTQIKDSDLNCLIQSNNYIPPVRLKKKTFH